MFDLETHLKRQIAWSRATFGPGARTEGVSDHIRKELKEVELAADANDRVAEWVDIAILALDGLTRQLMTFDVSTDDAAGMACRAIVRKQARNEKRVWPDWRTADPNKAIEHVRSEDNG